MDYTKPQVAQLRQRFLMLDTDGDQYITKQQLIAFMANQLGHLQPAIWQTNNMMLAMKDEKYISQQDFIIWIMGCRIKLQSLAIVKFNLKKSLSKYQSASPPELEAALKRSFVDFKISNQKVNEEDLHKLQLSLGIDKESQFQKKELIAKVLGRDPANIYLLIKFKCKQNGQQIAQNLQEVLQTIKSFAGQIIPELQSLFESLQLSVKHFQGDIYVIGQVSHTFLDCIVQYMDEASLTLSPQCKILLKLLIKSNVSKILQQSINLDSHGFQIKAQLDIDNISLSKLKQIIGEQQQKQIHDNDQKFTFMIFLLLQEIRLTSQFSNLKELLLSMGANEDNLPKPNQQLQVIKQMGIKDTLEGFIEGSGQLIQSLKNCCKPEGQLSINLSNFFVKIAFDLQIAGAFDIL